MLTCKETAQLISESLDRSLTLRERLGLRLHLWRCDMCSRYASQLKFLQGACADADPEKLLEGVELADSARERIRDRLAQEL